MKEIVSGLKKDYFYQKPEEMAADMQICLPYMEELVGLVKCFSQRFDAKKRQENVIDFSDMEQFALQILAKKTEEGFEPSEVAKEYQDQFREIMIDEYQDSNLIQETIRKENIIFLWWEMSSRVFIASGCPDQSFLWKSLTRMIWKKDQNKGLIFIKTSGAEKKYWTV